VFGTLLERQGLLVEEIFPGHVGPPR
jgi:hypothetical protein